MFKALCVFLFCLALTWAVVTAASVMPVLKLAGEIQRGMGNE